jgi:hypothetical protein
MARKSSSPVKLQKPAEQGNVFLPSGQITEKFAKWNLVISDTIQIRGDQTLEDLPSRPGARRSRCPARTRPHDLARKIGAGLALTPAPRTAPGISSRHSAQQPITG